MIACHTQFTHQRLFSRLQAAWHVVTRHDQSNLRKKWLNFFLFVLQGENKEWLYKDYQLLQVDKPASKELFHFAKTEVDRLPFLLNKQPIIVDAGAHIGDSTLAFITRYPAGKIFAIEANPQLIPILQNNISHNNFDSQVQLIGKALISQRHFNTSKTITLHLAPEFNYSATINPKYELRYFTEPTKKITVPAITLKALLQHIQAPIDLLKLDIEGGEYELIDDILSLSKKITFLAIEFHYRKAREMNRIFYQALFKLSRRFEMVPIPQTAFGFDAPSFPPQDFSLLFVGKRKGSPSNVSETHTAHQQVKSILERFI